jgi:hypothetical protein
MTPQQKRAECEAIKDATGIRPLGFNAFSVQVD